MLSKSTCSLKIYFESSLDLIFKEPVKEFFERKKHKEREQCMNVKYENQICKLTLTLIPKLSSSIKIMIWIINYNCYMN